MPRFALAFALILSPPLAAAQPTPKLRPLRRWPFVRSYLPRSTDEAITLVSQDASASGTTDGSRSNTGSGTGTGGTSAVPRGRRGWRAAEGDPSTEPYGSGSGSDAPRRSPVQPVRDLDQEGVVGVDREEIAELLPP